MSLLINEEEEERSRAGYGRPDPEGPAAPPRYLHAGEYLADWFAVVRARVAAAIQVRWQRGLLAAEGDVASTLTLGRERVMALLAEHLPPEARELPSFAEESERARAVIARRLESTRTLGGIRLPLAAAFAAWGLPDEDQFLIVCLLAAELSPTLARLLSYLSGDVQRPGLTVETAASLAHAPDGGLLAIGEQLRAAAPLGRLALVSVGGAPELAFLRRPLRLAPRVLALARGQWSLDESLSGVELIERPRGAVAFRHLSPDTIEQLRQLCRRACPEEPIGVVLSRRGVGVPAALADLALEEARPALVARFGSLARNDELGAALVREALLFQAILVLVDDSVVGRDAVATGSAEGAAGTTAEPIERLARTELPVLLVIERSEAKAPALAVPLVQVEIPVPDASVRLELWRAALGTSQSTELDLETLASTYHVGAEIIARAGAAVRAMTLHRAGGAARPEDVSAALGAQLGADLSSVATRLVVTQTWDDLVLPDEAGNLVLELIDRARFGRRVLLEWGFARKVGKGLGLVALFSGRPGTGKSMVAGLVARQLGLEAYQIDISRVVSKWIGETEKALAAAFDAAEAGHALLVFDEADALFGKRITDTKTATDRYANVETNYILNRLEWFSGIAILTTNLEGNLDPAFQRRVGMHVRFPFPDERQRALLWQAILPPEAPVEGKIDHELLARTYQLSGGQIRNVALRAAFLAAAGGEPLSMHWIRLAAERQYLDRGKLLASGELE